MTRRQYYVALAVVAVTGLAGGILGSWLFRGQAAFAQEVGFEQVVQARAVEARELWLVDEERKLQAIISGGNVLSPGLTVADARGSRRIAVEFEEDKTEFHIVSARPSAFSRICLSAGGPIEPTLSVWNHVGGVAGLGFLGNEPSEPFLLLSGGHTCRDELPNTKLTLTALRTMARAHNLDLGIPEVYGE